MLSRNCKYFLKTLPRYGHAIGGNRCVHLGEANVIGTPVDASSAEYQVNKKVIFEGFFLECVS